jgi:hypothetical protein
VSNEPKRSLPGEWGPRIRLKNSAEKPLEVQFEPWGSTTEIAPNDFINIEFPTEASHPLQVVGEYVHLEFHNGNFISVVSNGSDFRIFNSKDVEISI